jgi:exosome complex RNA-binding protein Csl4
MPTAFAGAAGLTRATVEHAPTCERPGWHIDTSPRRFGVVVARCTSCGAVEWRLH